MEPGQRIILYTSIDRMSRQLGDRIRPAPVAAERTLSPCEPSPWQKICIERVSRDLTAADISNRAGISLDDLRRIEAGQLRDATMVHRIDRVLGTSFFNEYLNR